ncbi:LOW QUALITY PROTEIN: laforin-like [Mustela erminea]|uniref:LOW QUALITY PROTEIN: laforin-like n=1 Tax=Mustela erminea TaxID=36723 RepID=UPI001387209D|nr:LOW QUALITY PROTEIN: laforin-like [Mustela erminea]
MSRYRSSWWSRRCSSCDVELRLFFTPCEDAEQRREQGGAAAQLGRRSLFRFMEAAAARQGATTMAPSVRSPAEARRPRARALRAAGAERRCGDGGRGSSPAGGGGAGVGGGAGPTAPAPLPPAAAKGPAPQPRLQRLLPPPAPPSPPPGARSPLGRPRRRCCRRRLGLPGVTARAHRSRGRCCRSAEAQSAAAPGDPRRAVPWSFIHKKGPTTLLGARRMGLFIGQ